MKDKKKDGRPTKYTPSMCDVVVEMMREGASKIEVCAKLGISSETMSQWSKPESDYYNQNFSDAVKKGEQLSEAWWQKKARDHLVYHPKGEQLNATLWYMNMKNRFGWKDKHEISGDKDSPLEVNHNLNFKNMDDAELNRYLDQAKKG